MILRRIPSATLWLAGLILTEQAIAQGPSAVQPHAPPSAQQAAIFDLTGYWVSVITEDWRWRMMTPSKGDYASVPLNPAGRKVADQFDPSLYGGANYHTSQIIDCRAFGAAGLMRMPIRLHIRWQDANDLSLETDRGEQTRELHFVPGQPYETLEQPVTAETAEAQVAPAKRGAPSLQGYSIAVWEQAYRFDANSFQRGPPANDRGGLGRVAVNITQPGGDLAVVTDNLKAGWLRRNGVPYGSRTRLIEHFQPFQDPTGAQWFDVTSEVDDAEYLTAPFVTSSDFEKESAATKWAPRPCKQVVED